MASKIEICNLALTHLGVGKEIANLETEASEAAEACNRVYDLSRQETLRDFNWPFATRFVALALVEENPTTEWAYSYRYPSDCLKIKRILSGLRNDNRQSRIPYKIIGDNSGSLIYCDEKLAECEYTFNEEDPAKYPVDFIMALSFRVGYYIASRLTKGDPFKLKDYCLQMYQATISKAARNSFNEQQDEEEVESEFIRSRY